MLRSVFIAIVALLLFITSFMGISIPVARMLIAREEKARTEVVGQTVPGAFPVLVVYSKGPSTPEARIVFHRALPDFLREHPRHSFFVPQDATARLNAYLAGHPSLEEVTQSVQPDQPFGAGRFQVEELGNGRQRLRVEGTWDDDRVNVGWYETDGSSIEPQRYLTYFGPGFVMKSLPISGAITLGFWMLAVVLWRRFTQRTAVS